MKFFFLYRNFKGPSEQPFKCILNVRNVRVKREYACFFSFFLCLKLLFFEGIMKWKHILIHLSSWTILLNSYQLPSLSRERERRKARDKTLPLLLLIFYYSVPYFKICLRIQNIDMPKLKGRTLQSRRAWALGRVRKENIAGEHERGCLPHHDTLAFEHVIPNKFLLVGTRCQIIRYKHRMNPHA